ncbi:anti-sigma factor family protein, partial [Pseudomonas sp.]|uniref:anti-sigma factor family protein n=1 Tax=Pseudomonas sp. TaxID=306 RepID=UPI003D6F9453
MISLPPSERDLHAYVDHQLLESDRRVLETWLAAHPDVAAQVVGWQQDAQLLRASLSGALQQPANPELDPALIRQRIKQQTRRHFASAAVLLIAVSLGGLGGWQAREATQPPILPMADAMQAFRMFAQDG